MMTYDELLKKRRAIRHFENRDVQASIISDIIEETCLAPSAGNRQPWEFVIIRNREMIKQLSDESKANFLTDLASNPDSPIIVGYPTLIPDIPQRKSPKILKIVS